MSRAGTVRISITSSMTGRSSTKLELMPNSVELCGMVKGASETDTPLTSTRLKTFAPISSSGRWKRRASADAPSTNQSPPLLKKSSHTINSSTGMRITISPG